MSADLTWNLKRGIDGGIEKGLPLGESIAHGELEENDRVTPPGMNVWLPPVQIAQFAIQDMTQQQRIP